MELKGCLSKAKAPLALPFLKVEVMTLKNKPHKCGFNSTAKRQGFTPFLIENAHLFLYNKKQLKDSIIIIVMPETREDVEKYISGSKVNIDNFIRKNEYRKAFGLLIVFLERLDGEEKAQVIDYYSKNMQQLGIFTPFYISNADYF